MPSHTTLSDGSRLDFPDGYNNDQMTAAYNSAERALFDKYTGQAAAQGSPVRTGTTVYSGTEAYPNNLHGNIMAWLNTHAGGDALNRSQIGQAISNYVGPAIATGSRIASNAENLNPVAGLANLGVSGYDMLRGVAQRHGVPGSSYLPYGLTTPEITRQVFGTPELARDAGPLRSAAENTASLLMNPNQSLSGAVLRTGGSEIAGDAAGAIAGHYLGPDAADVAHYAGNFLGASPEVAGRPLAAVPRALASPNAQETYEQGRTAGIDPSFSALASPTGQRVARWISALPLVGSPIANANERTATQIQGVRDQAARDIAGGAPYGTSPEEIGQNLVSGAQQALPALQTYRKGLHQDVDAAMQGQTVDIAPVVGAMNAALKGNVTTPSNQAMILNKTNELASMAPGGSAYDASTRGPVPPLPQPSMEIPWSAAKDFRTGLVYALDKNEPHVPDNFVDVMKQGMTNAMQTAANRAGQGQAFDLANQVYASTKPVVQEFTALGGRPVGNTFLDPMNQAVAYNKYFGPTARQSSTQLENVSNPAYFPSSYFNAASAGVVGGLGAADQGSFRPEWFANQWNKISPPVQEILTQSTTGAPSLTQQDLNAASTVGQSAVTPVSRSGLVHALGAGAAIEGARRMMEEAGMSTAGTAGALALPAAATYGTALGIESSPFRRAMANQGLTPLVQQLYQGVPAAAMATQGNQPWPNQ